MFSIMFVPINTKVTVKGFFFPTFSSIFFVVSLITLILTWQLIKSYIFEHVPFSFWENHSRLRNPLSFLIRLFLFCLLIFYHMYFEQQFIIRQLVNIFYNSTYYLFVPLVGLVCWTEEFYFLTISIIFSLLLSF